MFRKTFTGIEIDESLINVAQIKRERDTWRLLRYDSVPLPENTLKVSYKKENIIDSDIFSETIKTSLESINGRISTVGLSVPNKIAKISILKFEDLPKDDEDIQRMITWQIQKTLRSPENNEKISYHKLDKDQDGKHRLFVTIGYQDVLKQYELLLRKIKIKAKTIRPAGINQFNFFINGMSHTGAVTYVGIYSNYFFFFVFEDDCLQFCRGVKKGYSDKDFFAEVDRTFQHYLNLNPDKEIEKIYIGSNVASYHELKKKFVDLTGSSVSVLDESQMILTNFDFDIPEERQKLSSFVSAIGAAQSLAQ